MTMFPDATVHQALDAITSTHLSGHSAWPGTGGANELSGAGYERAAVTLAAAASRRRVNAADVTLTMPDAGGTVAFLGLWDGATFKGFVPIRPTGTSRQGFATVTVGDTLTSAGHGLEVGHRIVMDTAAGTVPPGITVGVVYWVRTVPTADTFTLSATEGGATLDVTGSGEVWWAQVSPEVFANPGGTLTVLAGEFVLDGSVVG